MYITRRVGRLKMLVVLCMTSIGLLVGLGLGVSSLTASADEATKLPIDATTSLEKLPVALNEIKTPIIKQPQWLLDKKAAEAAVAKSKQAALGRIVSYSVSTRGPITANIAEFKQQANASLNDARGWSRLGVSFQEVTTGGQFTLVLAEASQLPTFSAGCSAEYSCRAGRYVIINQDRWMGATPSWNNAGGTLRDYRHMVVNHETGHWLGHDHVSCPAAGAAAPVMQQQSISLQGCTFNAWPTASELWSMQLGIRL